MTAISKAIAAKQAQIEKLQGDIDALQKAADILGGGKAKATAAQPKTTRKRSTMDAAAREAVSKRMKAYWAKRRKAKR